MIISYSKENPQGRNPDKSSLRRALQSETTQSGFQRGCLFSIYDGGIGGERSDFFVVNWKEAPLRKFVTQGPQPFLTWVWCCPVEVHSLLSLLSPPCTNIYTYSHKLFYCLYKFYLTFFIIFSGTALKITIRSNTFGQQLLSRHYSQNAAYCSRFS